MFRRIMLTALVAGGLAGLFASALQGVKVVPLILAAEVYEQAPAHDHGAGAAADSHHQDAPAADVQRVAMTVVANLLLGIGFASLLAGAVALSGREIGPGEGVLWGLGGFAAFTLAPSLGLPPELPGMAAADLFARQAWWLATALGTAGGLALLAFPKAVWARLLGLVLIVAPHAVGAPHVEGGGSGVPAELMARYATASIVTAGLFWVALGGLSGLVYRRLGRG